MIEFLGARVLEAVNFATLRVNPRHHMFDGAILARGVHRLKNEENGVAIVRIEQVLQFAQTIDLIRKQLSIVRFRFVEGFYLGRAFAEPERLIVPDTEFRGIRFHSMESSCISARAKYWTESGMICQFRFAP